MATCVCEDWDIKLIALANLKVACGDKVNINLLSASPSWGDVPEGLWHKVTLDTGEVGTARRVGDLLEFCFQETLIIQESSCLYITLAEEVVCESEELPTPEIVQYKYEYNVKRVDPCE